MAVFSTRNLLTLTLLAFAKKAARGNLDNFQSETATLKTDLLIFLTNKKLSAGTIYFRFLIYLKATYEQKMKEIDFSTLASKLRFWSIFPDRRS